MSTFYFQRFFGILCGVTLGDHIRLRRLTLAGIELASRETKIIEHCGECADIPCELLTQYFCDPEHGDTPKGLLVEQCKKWKEEKL